MRDRRAIILSYKKKIPFVDVKRVCCILGKIPVVWPQANG